MIAGAVALVATGIGAFGGGALFAATIGASTASVAAIAGTVSAVASIGAQALTKPPAAKGSASQLLIGSNVPTPYIIGEAYSAGILVAEDGYGGKVGKVTNPYRIQVIVHSLGPVEQIVGSYTDFAPVTFAGTAATGYFSGFLYRATQLGACPEASALAPQWTGSSRWGPSYKLSGLCAVMRSLKFDKDGKRFSGGVPAMGEVIRGVRVYDPRLDSTFPGGSGPQRIANETTWTWSRNPALHALAYAYGRYQNGKKVFGVDLGGAAIDLTAVVAWANVCEANDWTVNGTIYEPGDKWNNLKSICAAGSAEPMFAGGLLSFRWDAPRVSLDKITLDDLADGELSAPACRAWKERINSCVPRFRSPAHQWDYVAANAVTDATSVAGDGEEKVLERQWDLVTAGDQVAELAGYVVGNAREVGGIVLPLKPRFMDYRAGDALTLSAELATALAVTRPLLTIQQRSVDPSTGIVTLTLQTETPAKHDFALGRVATLPPAGVPITPEERDGVVGGNVEPTTAAHPIIEDTSTVAFPVTSTSDTIMIEAFTATIDTGERLYFPAATFTGLSPATKYTITRDRTSGAYALAPSGSAEALSELADGGNIIVRFYATAQADGSYAPGPTAPGGDGGGGYGGGGRYQNQADIP